MKSSSFSWKALDQEGNAHQGVWEVSQGAEVRNRLFAKGYYPLEIVPQGRRFRDFLFYLELIIKKSDQLRIWAGITQRLSLLLEAGIPVLLAIDILEKQSKGLGDHRAWEAVKEQLQAGEEMSEALEYLIPPPSPYIKAIVRAGERGGKLPDALGNLSRELFEEYDYRRQLRGALAYPVFLLVLTLGVIYVLSRLVLPVYERIYSSMGAELSYLTQVIFKVSHGLPFMILLISLGVILAVLALRLADPEHWRERLGDVLSRIPLFGKAYRLKDCRQFSQVLGTLLEAGIPLLEALRLTHGAVSTYSMKTLVAELEGAARAGQRLTSILSNRAEFPEDGGQMLEVGEESGQLSAMLKHLSRMFQIELEEHMNKVPRIVGPLLVMFLAGIIGLVAVGVLLPIFDMGTYLE